MQIIRVIEYVLIGYATILMVVGPILNLLCSIVCFTTNLRKYPSFIYIGVIGITDSIALIASQLKALLSTAFKFFPFDDDFYGIKFWIWVATMSMELASIVMVLMTTERILTMKIKMWRKRFFNGRKAVISIMIVLGYLLSLNSGILINGLTNNTNLTLYARFMSTDIMGVYLELFGLHYAMIPIPVLIIENAYLIYITLFKNGNIERSEEANKKRRSISVSVVLVTLLFVALNTPIAIIVSFFISVADPQHPNYWVYLFAVALQSTFESVSFLTLYKFNNLFKNEFHGLFTKNQKYVSSSTNIYSNPKSL